MLTTTRAKVEKVNLHNSSKFDENGYEILPKISERELLDLRFLIRNKYLRTLADFGLDRFDNEGSTFPRNYHNLNLKNHSSIWSKQHRIFSKKEVGQFLKLDLFEHLKTDFGFCKIADIEGLGYPEVYWRIVRPNNSNDVSGVHADSWFFTHTNKLSETQQKKLLKVWMPIEVIPADGGLGVYPGSHLKKWDYSTIKKDGRMKPKLDYTPDHEHYVLPLNPGEPVIFDRDLLHYGISHDSDYTRVSLEFAIEVSKNNM